MAYDGIDFTPYRKAFRNYAGLARLMRDARAQQKTVIFIYHVDSNGSQTIRGVNSGWHQEHVRYVNPPGNYDSTLAHEYERFTAPNRIPRRWFSYMNPGLHTSIAGTDVFGYDPDSPHMVNYQPSNTPGGVSVFSGMGGPGANPNAYTATNGRGMMNFSDPDSPDPYTGAWGNMPGFNSMALGHHFNGEKWGVQMGYIRFGTNRAPRASDDTYPTEWYRISPAIRMNNVPWEGYTFVSSIFNTTGQNSAGNEANRLDLTPNAPENEIVDLDLPDCQITFTTRRTLRFHIVVQPAPVSWAGGPFVMQYLDFVQKEDAEGNPVVGGVGGFTAHSRGGVSNKLFIGDTENAEAALVWHVKRIYEKLTALGDDVVIVPMVALRGLAPFQDEDRLGDDISAFGPLGTEVRYYGMNNTKGFGSEWVYFFGLWQRILHSAGVPKSARHIHFTGTIPLREINSETLDYTDERQRPAAVMHELWRRGLFDESYSYCDTLRLWAPDGVTNELATLDEGIPTADGYASSGDSTHLHVTGFARFARNWWGALLDEENSLGGDDPQFPGYAEEIFAQDEFDRLKGFLAAATTGGPTVEGIATVSMLG